MESDSHRHSNQPILIFLLTIQKKIVSILSIILRPFLKIITFIKSNILKKENGKVSEEYIKSLICKSEEEGIIQTYEKNMIESIFKFNDTKSKDIMTSRKDTFSINIDDDIEDEYDKENNNILKINERIFIVDCSIELDEFNEAFNLELEEGEYNTLNGYIINQLGEIPKSNEKVEIKVENVNIEVVKVSNKKIEKVKVSYIN